MLCGYFVLMHARVPGAAKAWLVLASLVFYDWNPQYLPLLLGSIAFNFLMGHALAARAGQPAGRRLLWCGVGANLALLGWFKYANFVVANVNLLAGANVALPAIVLPLGISFFTFTQIAWLVDSWRAEVRERSPLDYALFVTFFPHLIAGPILHHREMMGQFASRWTRALRTRNLLRGIFLLSLGLFKKVVLADTLAHWSDEGFGAGGELDFVAAWSTSLSYALQLYFDFSGYCDMAMGIALMFNIWLPVNFDSPYKSLDIQEFWRRWHITLSRFLRDYVYIPLGGNRGGEAAVSVNLMTTFLLGGLWHGASWMFIAWGALHGAAVVLHRAWKRRGRSLPAPAAWLVTFVFVDVAWVFFRAPDWHAARRVLRGMVDVASITTWDAARLATKDLAWSGTLFDGLAGLLPATVVARLGCLASIALGLWLVSRRNSLQLMERHAPGTRGVVLASLAFCPAAIVMLASRQSVFLYFNF